MRSMVIKMLLLAAALVPGTAMAIPYSGMYVFGDSLSDAGNVSAATGGAVPGAAYSNGRFTNGPVYADVLATRLGFVNQASLLGGTDFAFGGARTTSHFLSPQASILGQVAGYTGLPSSADPNALYVVFGGANDIQDAIRASLVGGLATGQAMALAAADNIAFAVESLANDGADRFLVPNTPNLALVPRVSALGLPAASFAATTLANDFNQRLAARLDTLESSLGIDIVRFDTFGLLEDVATNPFSYGLVNSTDRCYTGDDLTFTGGGTTCANPDQYLFWDSIHPTARFHELLGDRMYAALNVPEPQLVMLLLVGLLLMGGLRIRQQAMRK